MLEVNAGGWQQTYEYLDEAFQHVHTACIYRLDNDDSAIRYFCKVARWFSVKRLYVRRKTDAQESNWIILPYYFDSESHLVMVLGETVKPWHGYSQLNKIGR